MRHALDIPNFGEFAEVGIIAEAAAAAEEGGWDGFFIWDHLAPSFVPGVDLPTADVTVALAAIAQATTRIRFGALVTPLARRRAAKVARELASLDGLSGGRVVLGVGLGHPPDGEFAAFGDEADDRLRAGRLDESLEVITRLWRGERVDFDGEHLHVHTTAFRPVPVQQPRIPIWTAALWPAAPGPLRRARRWDGIVPMSRDLSGATVLTPHDIRQIVAAVGRGEGFDVVATGPPGSDRAAYEAAGATWWLDVAFTRDDALVRGRAGPPPT